MKRAVIVGATGLIGKHLLKLLLADPNFEKVTVLSRKPIAIQNSKLEVRIINFENATTFLKSTDQFTDAFCCLGTTMKKAGSIEAFYKVDFIYCFHFAQANVMINTPHFYMVTALDSDPNSSIFYNQVKGQIEVAISKLPFKSISFFQPFLLLGKRKEFRFGELFGKVVFLALAFLFKRKFIKYKPIEGKKVAKAMVKNALQADKIGVVTIESGLMFE